MSKTIEETSIYPGTLIAIEGIDGSGKSTLTRQLYVQLAQSFDKVCLTKEPGDTLLGAALRAILQNKEIPLTPKAEYLLFAADRTEHVETKVIPHLKQGYLVICDRMADSSVVYQGYARNVAINMINQINRWTMNDIVPGITLYLRVNAQTAQARIQKRNEQVTRFEAQPLSFYQALIDGFEDLYKNRQSCTIIDATQGPEQVLQDSLHAVQQHILQVVPSCR